MFGCSICRRPFLLRCCGHNRLPWDESNMTVQHVAFVFLFGKDVWCAYTRRSWKLPNLTYSKTSQIGINKHKSQPRRLSNTDNQIAVLTWRGAELSTYCKMFGPCSTLAVGGRFNFINSGGLLPATEVMYGQPNHPLVRRLGLNSVETANTWSSHIWWVSRSAPQRIQHSKEESSFDILNSGYSFVRHKIICACLWNLQDVWWVIICVHQKSV